MKKAEEMINVKMSHKEAMIIQSLIDKNQAKPMVKKNFKVMDGCYYECPTCGQLLIGTERYCSKCGQKIDNQNTAF